MSLWTFLNFTAIPNKNMLKSIMLSTVVTSTLIVTGCASKPQINQSKRYAKAPDYYTVVAGDTLSGIAARYGLNYINLAEMNDIAAPYRIFVGQSIRLKSSSQRTTTTQAMNQADPIQRQKIAIPTVTTTTTVTTPTTTLNTPSTTIITTPTTTGSTVQNTTTVTTTPAITSSRLAWVKPTTNPVLQNFNSAADIKGIRYSGNVGDPIYAAAAGQVVYAADGLKEYGNLVLIKHVDGYVSAYAHNSKMLVKSGQNVAAGHKVAEMGSSGTNRVMLEFQIRLNGKPIDPNSILSKN